MFIEVAGEESDFDWDVFDSFSSYGNLGGKPVKAIEAREKLEDFSIGKVVAAYSSSTQYFLAKIAGDGEKKQNEKPRESEKRSSGGIGISAEAKKEMNGNSKAQLDVRVEKRTERGGNVTVSAGAGIQKDSKGKISDEQHIKVDAYYSF